MRRPLGHPLTVPTCLLVALRTAVCIPAVGKGCRPQQPASQPCLPPTPLALVVGLVRLDLWLPPSLQEMLLEVGLVRRRGPPPQEHLLFGVLRKRLSSLGGGATVSDRLCRQQELCFQTW